MRIAAFILISALTLSKTFVLSGNDQEPLKSEESKNEDNLETKTSDSEDKRDIISVDLVPAFGGGRDCFGPVEPLDITLTPFVICYDGHNDKELEPMFVYRKRETEARHQWRLLLKLEHGSGFGHGYGYGNNFGYGFGHGYYGKREAEAEEESVNFEQQRQEEVQKMMPMGQMPQGYTYPNIPAMPPLGYGHPGGYPQGYGGYGGYGYGGYGYGKREAEASAYVGY